MRSFTLNPLLLGFESKNIAGLKVYPNPVTEFVHIESPWSKSEATIMNSLGTIFWKGCFDQSTADIDMSVFPAGLYVLKIFNDHEAAVTRLVKK